MTGHLLTTRQGPSHWLKAHVGHQSVEPKRRIQNLVLHCPVWSQACGMCLVWIEMWFECKYTPSFKNLVWKDECKLFIDHFPVNCMLKWYFGYIVWNEVYSMWLLENWGWHIIFLLDAPGLDCWPFITQRGHLLILLFGYYCRGG